MNIKFVKKHKDARLPERNHKDLLTGDAGFDLFAVEDVKIKPGRSAIVPVGIEVGSITPGFWFRIEARSGLGFKHSLQPHFGVIDNGYRGGLGIKIYNLSKQIQSIKKGQGCAQFVTFRMIKTDVSWMEEPKVKEEDIRGARGFGSSDKSIIAKSLDGDFVKEDSDD